MKANPLFKGLWQPELIDNPAYKGEWAPVKIANPSYFEDLHPADLRPIGAIGFEIWSMTEDILFDNIYIGHSPEDAKALAKETFHVKTAAEKEKKEAADKAAKEAADEAAAKAGISGDGLMDVLMKLKEDPVGYVREQVLSFIEDVQVDGPVDAFKAKPQVGGAILATALTLLGSVAALLGLIGSSAAPVSKSTKKTDAVVIEPKAPVVTVGPEVGVAPVAVNGTDATIKKRK